MFCSYFLQVSEDTRTHLASLAHLWANTRGKLSNITLKVDIEIRCTWLAEALGSAAATSLLFMHFNHPTHTRPSLAPSCYRLVLTPVWNATPASSIKLCYTLNALGFVYRMQELLSIAFYMIYINKIQCLDLLDFLR